ncbi:hypothetical protein HanIR_Chr04g0206591 [Helianthus annuus]|nr:hypothetical protein HanIR_Chr04g0206591 [Helianthus annuus]
MDIEELMRNADHAIEGDEMVKVAIDEIKTKLNSFMKNVDDLGMQADNCSRDVRRARTVVLQRIIKPHIINEAIVMVKMKSECVYFYQVMQNNGWF